MTGPGRSAALAGQVAAGFDHAAGRYDATGTEFFTDVGHRLVELAGVGPGATVLDVGCGKGAATIPAALATGPDGQVTGIDASAAMLEHASGAARSRGLSNVTLLQADALEPPVPDGSVDFVLAANLMQFLDNPELAAQRWLRTLRPGGTLALAWGVKQDPAFVPVMAALDNAVPAPLPGFEAFFRRPPFNTGDGLAEMLSGSGYRDPVTHVEPVVSVYQSPEQWWHACRGQAPWAVSWRHIPADALPAARAEAFAVLDGIRGADGTITRTLGFGYTLARRPTTTGGPASVTSFPTLEAARIGRRIRERRSRQSLARRRREPAWFGWRPTTTPPGAARAPRARQSYPRGLSGRRTSSGVALPSMEGRLRNAR